MVLGILSKLNYARKAQFIVGLINDINFPPEMKTTLINKIKAGLTNQPSPEASIDKTVPNSLEESNNKKRAELAERAKKMDSEHIDGRWGAMAETEEIEEGCDTEKKAIGKRAKEIMPSTKKEYGKEKGKDVAYAVATDQIKKK